MDEFTLKEIEILTGIRSQTLRIWQKRLELFPGKKTDNRHRLYTKEDLKRLLRISFFYHTGWKVIDIAILTEEEIEQQIKLEKINNDNIIALIHYLIVAAVDLNENFFMKTVDNIISMVGFENCIIKVCYPCLQKISMLWSDSNAIAPKEYFFSYLVRNKIISEITKIPVESAPPEILLISPQGTFHELQLLFIDYLFKKNGWRTIYLGKDIKLNEVIHLASLPNINYLFLYLYEGIRIFPDDYLEQVCKAFAGKKVITSGEGLKNMQRHFTNLLVLKTDQQIHDFIERNSIL